VLEKTSEEFTRIVDYVKNTHAATHQQYELQVVDVSTACRTHCIQWRQSKFIFRANGEGTKGHKMQRCEELEC